MKLCLQKFGELFIVDLDQVMYVEADDQFCHVYYTSDCHFQLPYYLFEFEEAVAALFADQPHPLVHAGDQFLIHSERVYHVNFSKHVVHLVNPKGKVIHLNVPSPALRELAEVLQLSIEAQ